MFVQTTWMANFRPEHRQAIVTIFPQPGDAEQWDRNCAPGWRDYCRKFGFDLIAIDGAGGHEARTIGILDRPWSGHYQRLVWLDPDVYITRGAPNILDAASDPTRIGISRYGDQLSEADRHIFIERIHGVLIPPGNAARAWELYLASVPGAAPGDPLLDTAVMVLTPALHAGIFRSAQDDGTFGPERVQLSRALASSNFVAPLTPRFNWNVNQALTLGFPEIPRFRMSARENERFQVLMFNEMSKAYFLNFSGSRPALTSLVEQLGRQAAAVSDYVSPGLSPVRPDAAFPNMIMGDPGANPWPYLRRNSPHPWYVDRRWPQVGFLSRDEAHLLHHSALQAKGSPALEIGCFMGWSACHLALAGVELDVIDPLLGEPGARASVTASLAAAGVLGRCRLIAGTSPETVAELAEGEAKRWSFIFIDGDHEGVAPRRDAEICAQFAAEDCIVLFHDLYAPAVADGLRAFKERGWRTRVYNTTQIMGVAWRGRMVPVDHIPDPRLPPELPAHLADLTA
jgi:predicted O-methyltransferase YrrM